MASPRIGNALLHGGRDGERWQHSLDAKVLRVEVGEGNVVKLDESRRQARATRTRPAFACSPRAMARLRRAPVVSR